MAKVIGNLGSEKALIKELRGFGIHSLNNLDDVENHIKNSNLKLKNLRETTQNKIREEIDELKRKQRELVSDRDKSRAERLHQLLVERDMLQSKVKELSVFSKNIFLRLLQYFRYWKTVRRQRVLVGSFDDEVERPFRQKNREIIALEKAIDNHEVNFEAELNKRIAPQILEKENIDRAIERAGKWLVGARGEKEVVDSLAVLPDSYTVINDVVLHFKPPLRTENGPRFQCQADHVIVGPTGVFNVETKYWSQKSIQNHDLRSPVEQIKITGKGLWRELNSAISKRHIRLKEHHWGDSNIRVRNILVMVGAMPNAEFQMVKLLPVDRLTGYLEYFEPVFQDNEVESIVFWFTSVAQHSAKRSA